VSGDLARRLVAAGEVHEAARVLLSGEPYDLAQTNTARDLEVLAARLAAASARAAQRERGAR
jgi:hypothetical protein